MNKIQIRFISVLIFLIFLNIFSISVFAGKGDLVFSTNQSEYYVPIGQNAILQIEVNNTYGKEIQGTLTFATSQKVQQGNSVFSSSNSQLVNAIIKTNSEPLFFDLGTANSPSEISINIKFDYQYEGQGVEATLPTIKFIFVANNQNQKEQNQQEQQNKNQQENQQQENQNQQQENQQQQNQNQQEQQNQQQNKINKQVSQSKTDKEKQEEQRQAEEQRQKRLNEQMKQQAKQNELQNRLQNNQINQNTNSLKQQIQKDLDKRKKQEKEFKKNLEKNEKFKEENQKMLDKGYSPSQNQITPKSNNTGNFEINYGKGNQSASIKGSMINNTINDLKINSPEKNEQALNTLKQNSKFQNLDNQLNKEGFLAQAPQFKQNKNDKNITEIKIEYKNKNNETAKITAKINQETNKVEKINLEKSTDKSWVWFLLFALPIITALIFAKNKKNKLKTTELKPSINSEFDFKKESLVILDFAQTLFDKREFKEAYAKVGEALRFYYIHNLKIKEELTNTKLIKHLKKNKQKYFKTNQCLNICAMVEFAKYKANKRDFDEAKNIAKNLILK